MHKGNNKDTHTLYSSFTAGIFILGNIPKQLKNRQQALYTLN